MTHAVFLAYPLTTARGEPRQVEGFVVQLRARLLASGFRVLPERSGVERIAEAVVGARDRELLESNVEAVTGASLLLLLLPPVVEPSSIWVEFGMAIAAGLTAVVVHSADAQLPFLVHLALKVGDLNGNRFVRVITDVPPEVGTEILLDQILAAVRSAV